MLLNILENIVAWDKAATLWINSFHCPASDAFWMFMSGIKVWIPMYVVIAALMIWRLGWKKGLVAIIFTLLAFAVSEQINNLIKHLVERVRPCNDEWMIAGGLHILESSNSWSFPSGHSNNSFTFALCSFMMFKAELTSIVRPDTSFSLRKKRIPAGVRLWVNCYGIFIFSWAFLVALSRIMVAKHYLLDITVGCLIGVALGYIFAVAAYRVMKMIG